MLANYFDNAATTPLDPRVLEEMLPFLRGDFGNANSLHEPGRKAHEAVELSRKRIAELIGAEDPSQITFTSGATESNNWVLSAHSAIAISPFEHSSLLEPAKRVGAITLHNDGLTISPQSGRIQLVSVMAVNNEVGASWVAPDFRGDAVALHSDITQAVGKLPIQLEGIDFASFSAHKFYGPKGVGALYAQNTPPKPLILGGEQEHGFRGGTLNVPGIVGMGAAAAIAAEELEDNLKNAREVRGAVLDALSACPDMRVNGGPNASPYILSLSFLGIEGETHVIEMDRQGYAISAGAACSSRSTEPSHVLTAMGVEPEWRRGTIRISFGKYNKCDNGRNLGLSLLAASEMLRKMH